MKDNDLLKRYDKTSDFRKLNVTVAVNSSEWVAKGDLAVIAEAPDEMFWFHDESGVLSRNCANEEKSQLVINKGFKIIF
jgi:hypothetical protein